MNQHSHPCLSSPIRAVCFDWGGTLMADDGPSGVPMCEWPRLTPLPGAEQCLRALHGRVPLYVATNAADSSRAMIERALDRAGLLPYFDGVFCFRELGCRKDRPQFWHIVQERLDMEPGHIVMVGDSLDQDVVMPRRCGMQAVWFNEGGRCPTPANTVPMVTALADFAGLVDGLLAEPARLPNRTD